MSDSSDGVLQDSLTPGETRSVPRVGFVVHVLGIAGAEALVAATIRRLGAAIEPSVLCLDDIGPLGEELRAEGVEVVALDRRPGLDWGLARRLAVEIDRLDLDVVHAHQYSPFFYSALAKLIGRGSFRLILTEHGRHYPDVVSWKRRLANRLVLARQADALNACCRFSGEALSQRDGFPADRIEVIENGISLECYEPAEDRAAARRALGLSETTRYIAMIGRFHPVKDHATMIRAFSLIARSRSDVELLLVGDGVLRPDLEKQVAEAGLEGRVTFTGVRRDVPRILGAIDVFALTSVTEAASLTLLEAMASAVPVVVTEVGGNPEIVREGVEGRLVGRGDAGAVAEAIIDLLDHPAKAVAMGEAGRRRVMDRYDLRRTIASYGELYARLGSSGATENASRSVGARAR